MESALSFDDFKKTLVVADRGKTSDLLTSLGYVRESVTPELLMRASAEQGDDFNVPYGYILVESLNDRVTQSLFDGNIALEYIGTLGNFLLGGAKLAPGIINSANGTDRALANANLAMQERMMAENSSRTGKIILAVAAIVVIVVVVVVYFKSVR